MRTAFLIGLLCVPLAALADDDPVAIIEQTTADIIELLDGRRDYYREHPDALRSELRAILLPRIDTVYSARLVLGRHGRGLETEQIEAFAKALADQLLQRYATALLDYRLRDRIEILPLTGDNTERMTRVRTRVRLNGSSRAPIDYVFRNNDDQWLVFDVIVEGISYVSTFRSQIDPELSRHGFDRLLDRLQSGELALETDD